MAPVSVSVVFAIAAFSPLPSAEPVAGQERTGDNLVPGSDTVHVAPPTGERETDRARVLAALEGGRPGDVVQFAPGTYLVGEVIRVETPRLTLRGHPDGTVLRGCDPAEYRAIEREFVEAEGRPPSRELVSRCGMFELTGGDVTVRGLTFEHSRMGLLLGCCHTEPRFQLTPGGYTIERNVFRNTLNGIRPWTTEPSVIRGNRFINTFHAISGVGSHLRVLDNEISAPEPARVAGIGHPSFAIALGPLPGPAATGLGLEENGVGSVIAGNRIEGHPDGILITVYPGSSFRGNEIRDNTIEVTRVPIPPAGPRSYVVDVTAPGDSTIVGIPIALYTRSGFPGADARTLEDGWFEDNLIEGNQILGAEGVGLALQRGRGNRIVDNHIARVERRQPFPGNTVVPSSELWRTANGAGIWISADSEDNEVAGNTFEDVAGDTLVVAADEGGTASAPGDTLEALPSDSAYLWLEELHSDTVLRWSEARTARTVEQLESLPLYDSLLAEIRSARQTGRFVPQNDVRPPAILTGPFANRFPGGRAWLRQPVELYEQDANAWESVLDLDSLSRAEGDRYTPESVECLPPNHERCLLLLSRDGRDRILDLREFDAGAKEFVPEGFDLREAHTSAFWRDENSLYITTKPMGWADRALVWSRGEPLDSASVLLTADPGARGLSFERRGTRLLLLHSHHQYDIEYHLVRDDELVPLPVPRDVRKITFVGGRLILQLRSGWQPADVAFPPGSLIAIELDDFLEGERGFDLVVRSDRDLVVDEIWTTRHLLVVRALADLEIRLFEFVHRDGRWERRRIDIPGSGRVEVRNATPKSDRYYFTHEDFLSPRTAYVRRASGEVEAGGRSRPAFPADPYEVRRWHTTSADGTRIPYFVVHEEKMPLDGRNPVIVSGYGGNGISILPRYLSLHGPTWLSRGGVYVLANIRGGNEYGPEWHDAVRREKRQRAFDDFQAVARDLVERGVTSPGMIGTYGGSNGGILVATSFIQQPDLYGAVVSYNGVLELHRCSQLSGDPPVGERGNGQDPTDWAYMRSYSPFHNLREDEPYPALLLLANRADDVVHPCHSRKFTAKLEDLGYRDVFLYETETGGHGKSYSPEEEAMIMSFFLEHLHPDEGSVPTVKTATAGEPSRAESLDLPAREGPRRDVPEYTIEQFMETVTILRAGFSPDGDRILLTSDASGVPNAWVVPFGGGEPVQLTRSGDAVYTRGYFPTDDRFLYSSDRGGDELYHLFVRNPDGSVQDLTPGEDVRAIFLGWSADDRSFFFASNERDPRSMDLYEMTLDGYERTLLYRNDRRMRIGAISPDRRYLGLLRLTSNRDRDLILHDRQAGTHTNLSPVEGDVRQIPRGFGPNGRYLYYITDEGSEFTYLARYDLETGKHETVFQAAWDVMNVSFSPAGRYLSVAVNNDARTEVVILETTTLEPVSLPPIPRGDISAVTFSRDERRLAFRVASGRSPGNLYVLDLDGGEPRLLLRTLSPQIDPEHLVEPRVVRFASYDGLEIPGLLYRPHGASAEAPAPAMIWIHGGPGLQSRVRYDPLIQYLVNHGYAVYAINNRGSSGYGKSFAALDDHRHGEADLGDVVASKEMLIETGWIDPERIGVIGASYGGFLTMAALTFRPEEFAVGVNIYGVMNWIRSLESRDRERPWLMSGGWAASELGDPVADRERLRRISPLFHADRITKPFLVLQGANDPRVLQVESDEIVAAARANGVPVEYVVFLDEGHGFRKKDNRARAYRAILEFLGRHLK